MSKTIAVSGKGGTGKTTIAAIMIRILKEKYSNGKGILGIDADPNSCLALTLGVDVVDTISKIREQARNKKADNTGMDRTRSFEYGIQQVISEASGFDLLTMGQPEGPDCYCAANNLLRQFMDKLNSQYSYVVIDNEAGMEHLSRRTTNNVDLLFIIAEPTPIGKVTAQRISNLTKTLPIEVKETGIIWNKADSNAEVDGINNFGCVPLDNLVLEASMQGKAISDIDADSPAIMAIRKILENKLTN
jgi:CO dehydrogenase maturation factor